MIYLYMPKYITTIRCSKSFRDYLKRKTFDKGLRSIEEYLRLREGGFYKE